MNSAAVGAHKPLDQLDEELRLKKIEDYLVYSVLNGYRHRGRETHAPVYVVAFHETTGHAERKLHAERKIQGARDVQDQGTF